jgi:hypothetical protein
MGRHREVRKGFGGRDLGAPAAGIGLDRGAQRGIGQARQGESCVVDHLVSEPGLPAVLDHLHALGVGGLGVLAPWS